MDGQYYHYLTKWMHALAASAVVLNNETYWIQSLELAKGIHPKFVKGSRIFWKVSNLFNLFQSFFSLIPI